MDLCENKKLKSTPGDYGVKVAGKKTKKLAVPTEIFAILSSLGISTAEGFHAAPYAKATQDRLLMELEQKLGWTVSDFMAAASKLGTILTLDGGLDESALYRLPPVRSARSLRRAPRERRLRVGA
jgi:hypothetical protein